MSSIVRQKVGGNTYLYESVSYRNEEGKPRNRRIPVGKIDKKSGLPVYKQEYIDRMVRRESCAVPTGESPVRVSAEAPGSRVRS